MGKLLAQRDAVVVCGGRGGVMSSGAAGARSAGGQVIGLLPGSEPADANPHVTVAIPTGMGQMRNGLIANACAAMIAVGGSYGTLSEIGFMRKLGRPVATLESWKVAAPETPDPIKTSRLPIPSRSGRLGPSKGWLKGYLFLTETSPLLVELQL